MEMHKLLGKVYDAMEGSEILQDYSSRHNINSAAVLTVLDDNSAALIVDHLRDTFRAEFNHAKAIYRAMIAAEDA